MSVPKTEIPQITSPKARFSISNWFKSAKSQVNVPTIPETKISTPQIKSPEIPKV
jgi:hypothetical protein